MSQPRKERICRDFEGRRVFVPCGAAREELVFSCLPLDQLEALCLCDLEGLTQEEAGERMGVSRGTVQRLLAAGRATVVGALLETRALVLGRDTDPEAVAGAGAGGAAGPGGAA